MTSNINVKALIIGLALLTAVWGIGALTSYWVNDYSAMRHVAIYDGGVSFRGLWENERVEYSYVCVNFSDQTEVPSMWIDVNGQIQEVCKLSLEQFQKWNATSRRGSRFASQYWKICFGDPSTSPCMLGAEFVGDKLAQLDFIHYLENKSVCPVRISSDGKEWVTLPVTEGDLVASFGPPLEFRRRRLPH